MRRAASGGSNPVARTFDDGDLDPSLAEGGQYLLDIGEEQTVRTEHQHALAFEGEAVGGEQVRSPVQCDDRLSGARPTLHDQHPGKRRTNALVLLALDRRDDVAQLARPCGLERADQCALTVDPTVAETVAGLAEELVLDAPQHPARRCEVATP